MNPIIKDNGSKYWYNDNNQLHRLDGPAVESYYGSKEWWVNGKLHRLDGPAIEFFGAPKLPDFVIARYQIVPDYKRWYINDVEIHCQNNEEFLRIVKMKELL
jgi:hypothetical protein